MLSRCKVGNYLQTRLNTFTEVAHRYLRPGRPQPGDAMRKITHRRLRLTTERDKKAIVREACADGVFPSVTNLMRASKPKILAGDEVLATAILSCLLHDSHVLDVKGRSYRLRDLEGPLPGRANPWGTQDRVSPQCERLGVAGQISSLGASRVSSVRMAERDLLLERQADLGDGVWCDHSTTPMRLRGGSDW